MKVYQILEAPESKPSNVIKFPEGGKRPLVVDKDGISYRTSDGTTITKKNPSDLATELENTDSKIGKKLKKNKWRARGKRLYNLLLKKVPLIGLSLTAQGGAILFKYWQDVEAFKAIWAATYPAGHALALGSPYYQEAVASTLKPLQYSAIAAASTVMALELSRIIKTGKVRKIVRAINLLTTPLVAIPIVGWVAKALVFALTEGAIWAAGWTVQRYGPEFFHYILNNEMEEMLEDLGEISTPPPPAADVDVEELNKLIKKELASQQNGEVPTPPSTDLDKKLKSANIDLDKFVIPD